MVSLQLTHIRPIAYYYHDIGINTHISIRSYLLDECILFAVLKFKCKQQFSAFPFKLDLKLAKIPWAYLQYSIALCI